MDTTAQMETPQADVHICVARAGESLYLPESVMAALGLTDGGSYAVVALNGLVLIAPQGQALSTLCPCLGEALPCDDDTVPSLLAQLDTVRAQIASQISERVCSN